MAAKKTSKKKATFNFSLIPRCLVEATEAALTSYVTPLLFLNGPRAGVAHHKVEIERIHETAFALEIFRHLLMHPTLLEKQYDIRWEHELKKAKGANVPRSDLFLSAQAGGGGVKTWVEIGRLSKKKVEKDAKKLLKHRPHDARFLLMLDLSPPKTRTSDAKMHKRMLVAAKQTISGGTLQTHENASRLLTLPITLGDGSKPRVGFGLLKVA